VDWLKTPPVIAAFITAWVAIGSYVSSAVTASIQASLELQKFQASMLLSILTDNAAPTARGARVMIAIQSGMISDKDGRICAAFSQGQECPVKVLNDKKLTDYKDGNRQTPPPLNASDCPCITRVLKCELTPHPPRSAPERDGAEIGAVS
jgi:hypothetical protein